MLPVKTLVYRCAERQQKKAAPYAWDGGLRTSLIELFLPVAAANCRCAVFPSPLARLRALFSGVMPPFRVAHAGSSTIPKPARRTKEGWITMIGTNLDAFVTVRL